MFHTSLVIALLPKICFFKNLCLSENEIYVSQNYIKRAIWTFLFGKKVIK